MKTSVLFAIFALSVVTAPFSFADVTVKTGGENSGNPQEALFLCNAGISHPRPAIIPRRDCTTEGENCVSETIYDPARGSDFLRVNGYQTLVAPVSGRAVVASNQEQWFNKITELSVNMGSEAYGTTYNLDFCYRGPVPYYKKDKKKGCAEGQTEDGGYCYGDPGKIDPKKPPVDLSEGLYELGTFLSAAGNAYLSNTQLKGRFHFVCSFRSAKGGGGRGAEELSDPSLSLGNGGGAFTSLGSLSMFSAPLNTSAKMVPRFCLIRFEFKEFTSAQRKHLSDNAEVTVGLDIQKVSGPEEEEEDTSKGTEAIP
ncbi:MAG: hypothetical protein HUU57_12720 [Bdellovibrio sp.]|nr:hypothetical protein [Bdellovibrio sp.]